MVNVAENGTGLNREPGKIDTTSTNPVMSRRRFVGGTLLLFSAEVFASACGVPPKGGILPSASANTSTLKPDVSPSTVISSPDATPRIQTISGDTLTKAFSRFSDTTEVKIPSAGGAITKSGKDLAKHASEVWNNNITTRTAFFNPTHALELALSSADMTGKDGTIDMSQMFPELSLKLSRLNLSILPNGKGTETAVNVFPKNLVLRKGMNMIVVGVDDSTKEAIVAFEDTLRKPNKAPTMYLAVLPLDVQGETDGQVSLNELIARSGAAYEASTHSIIYENGETLPLNSLDSALSKNLHQAAGSYFLDHDPLRQNKDGTPAIETNPVIPTPDAAIVPIGSKIEQLKDGRMVAVDSKGNPIARAANLGGEWKWVKPDEAAKLNYFFRELADGLGIKIGTAPDGAQINNGNRTYLDKVGEYFNQEQASVGGWENLNPKPGVFNFTWADRVVNLGVSNNMTIHSDLIWGGALPSWLTEGNYSQSQLRGLAKTFITTVMEHYKGQIDAWTVVNEPIWQGLDLANGGFWQKNFGANYEDFVLDCFKWAKDADPSASLILSDYANEGRVQQVSEDFYRLTKRLLAKGAPIDGVGLESHLVYQYDNPSVNPQFSPENYASWIKKNQALGLKVFLPEFDVDMTGFPGTKAKEFEVQGQWYHDFLQAALNAGVKNFNIYGLTDGTSWYNLTGRPNANPLILNDDYSAKPAYLAIQEVLLSLYGTKS